MYYILIALNAFLAASADEAQTIWVELGPEIKSSGLGITNLGDGRTAPAEFGGKACVRTLVEEGSTYIYILVDDAFPPERTLFLTVDFFDQAGMVSLEYDAGEGMSAYLPAPEAYAQKGKNKWRTETFTVRHSVMKNHQNGGADLRLHADGPLAVSRIALSAKAPEGFTPAPDPASYFDSRGPVEIPEDMTVIQQWQIHEPVAPGQLMDTAYETARKIGITSLQSYVGWAQLEPEKGVLDYSIYDPVVAPLSKHGLKWLPFLIVGPLVATPDWFRAEQGVDSVCLEHGESTPIQSIWNPNLRSGVRRFLEVFQAHYKAEDIEALNLGISGNWGESIMVAGGGFGMQGKHSHLGWWCGDEHARTDWRRWVKARYESLDAVNSAWGAAYKDWAEVEPFIPMDHSSRRAGADLFRWYTESMTDYAEFWVKTARELYPDTPIYLCTGGNGQPELGADFAAQARMCAKYNAGIRITNQSDDAPGNFAVTRMVSSAARLYGGYYTTEPGGDNSTKGIAGRVFDVVSGGAIGAYFKGLVDPPDRFSPNAEVFARNAEYFVRNTPKLSVAALMPNSSLSFARKNIDTFIIRTQALRDALDFEFMDENMISDGLLKPFKALLIPAENSVEQAVLDAIGAWVNKGGVVIAVDETGTLRDVVGAPASWWPTDFGIEVEGGEAAAVGEGFVVMLRDEWPAWREPMAKLLFAQDGVPWSPLLSELLDGAFDGVLASRVGDRVFYYNNGDVEVSKDIPGVGSFTVPPRGIMAVKP